MMRSISRVRALVRGAAVPICAALVFSFAWVVSPSADGSLGVSVAEAKGDKAKGGGKGDSKTLRSAKSDRKGGKKDRTAKSDRKGGKTDRTAKSDRKGDKTDRTAKSDRKVGKKDRTTTTERTKGKDRTERTAATGETHGDDDRRVGEDDAYERDEEHAYDRDHDHDGDDAHDHDDSYDRDDDVASTDDDDEVAGKRNWGATASQLKHRNAANANENAFRNASPNSNVGRLSTYRDAARATVDQESAIGDIDDEIDALQRERDLAETDGYHRTAEEIDEEILRLEDERRLAEKELYDLRVAEEDAYHAVGGPKLDDHDYAVFRRMLGID